jgi:hypothetical protein
LLVPGGLLRSRQQEAMVALTAAVDIKGEPVEHDGQ